MSTTMKTIVQRIKSSCPLATIYTVPDGVGDLELAIDLRNQRDPIGMSFQSSFSYVNVQNLIPTSRNYKSEFKVFCEVSVFEYEAWDTYVFGAYFNLHTNRIRSFGGFHALPSTSSPSSSLIYDQFSIAKMLAKEAGFNSETEYHVRKISVAYFRHHQNNRRQKTISSCFGRLCCKYT